MLLARAPFNRWANQNKVEIGVNCFQPCGLGQKTSGNYNSPNPYTCGGAADTSVTPDARLALIKSTGFDFVRGTANSPINPLLRPLGDGWFRASFATTVTVDLYNLLSLADAGTGSGFPSFSGDGASGTYVWGGQTELSNGHNIPGIYVPAISNASVTRPRGHKRTGELL